MEDAAQTMEVETQRGKNLTYLTVYPKGYDPDLDYPLVILLHGFGASMYDLAELAKLIHTTGYIYVCPNAPTPIQLAPGALGFAWSTPGTDDPEQALRVEQKLEGFFQEIMEKYRVTPKHTILLGFSQGGGLAYRCGLGRPDLFAGLVALSCSIRDQEQMKQRLPAERNQPIFIAHGLQDNIDRARSSRDFLEAERYTPTYTEYEMAHEINQDVMRDLVPWIQRVLPPLQLTP
jgi:phospholipase/carboxylesterase